VRREIKFRAKRSDTGEWAYGSFIQSCYNEPTQIKQCGGCWEDPDWEYYDVNPETVGQYIEAQDAKGVEIYEGDIVTLMGDIYQVCHNDYLCAFVLCDKDGDMWERIADDCPQHTAKDLEVIGNIHDNPELMDGKEADYET